MRTVYRGSSSQRIAPPAPAPTFGLPVVEASGEVDTSRFVTGVAYIFAVLLVLRLLLTDSVLNQFINYTGEGGFILEKIHPCTQAIVLLLFITLAKVKVSLTPSEALIIRQMCILMAVIVALVMLVQVMGRPIAIGYLLDTYIGACLVCFLMFALPLRHRRMIGHVIMAYLVVNSLVAIVEKATSFRLMPYPYVETVFRPTALTAHPLAVGLFSAGGAAFTLATGWRPWVKGLALLAFLLGTAASGARTGLIFTTLSILGALVLTDVGGQTGEQRLQRRLLLFGSMAFGGVLLFSIGLAAGFLERFEGGYIDENASARIDVYQVFDWVSWKDILFGADMLEIKAMVKDRLDLLIESSVVVFVFQFGLFGAITLAATIFWTVWRISSASDWRGVVASVTFCAVAMSNDTLSGKHFHFAVLFLCLIAFRNNSHDHLGRRVRPNWEA
ncbi:MAG TPA: VpsF family polysaccharide biosynthesis protein [Beijerinckiaceae bacterium]|nr:VpsF family polysaccharide biosynthesis protein [Beijerinckiaceae bacterium]